MADRAAEGVRCRRLARRVDEGVCHRVLGNRPGDHLSVVPARRLVPGRKSLDGLVALVGPPAAPQGAEPVLLLGDHSVEHRTQRRVVVDALHGLGNRGVEDGAVEVRRGGDEVGERVDVVVDEVLDEVHTGLLVGGRQSQTAGWVEVHPGRGGELEVTEGQGRVGTNGRGCRAVGLGEGARERLVRAVPGLDGDVEDGAVRPAGESVRRALEQYPAPQRSRRLPRGG